MGGKVKMNEVKMDGGEEMEGVAVHMPPGKVSTRALPPLHPPVLERSFLQRIPGRITNRTIPGKTTTNLFVGFDPSSFFSGLGSFRL